MPSVAMLPIYFLILGLDTAKTESVATYYIQNQFADKLCMSSSVKLSGSFSSHLVCTRRCKTSDGCMSFFYNSFEEECYTVNTILSSGDDCETRSNSNYYIRQETVVEIKPNIGQKLTIVYSDCYSYTQDDLNQMAIYSVPEKDQCESYQYHVIKEGSNKALYGCEDCNCCQYKGCYNGVPLDYNGTWSQTVSGRRCQRWDSQYPHTHNRDLFTFPQDDTVFDAHNYCRDPDGEGGAWCYTTDPSVRWEFCNIPEC